jgi:probable HAF family extracellular repeat protein
MRIKFYCSAVLQVTVAALSAFSTNLALAQRDPHTSPRYEVVDAGPIIARAIDERPGFNDQDDIAAWTTIQRTSSRADLRKSGQSTPLAGVPSDANSFAFAINDESAVAGVIESPQDMRFKQAFSWSEGKLTFLPTLGGKYSLARSINHSGTIVGASESHDGFYHAVVWKAGAVTELRALDGGDTSYANDVSGNGEIVGQSNDGPNRQAKAVRWTVDGAIAMLRTQPGSVFSNALAVNDRGQVVGFDNSQAVLWTNGREITLGSFGDDPNLALGINDDGDVVGSSAEAEGRMRAFLWTKGKLINLNHEIPEGSGWVLLSAFRINKYGEILAHGFHDGQSRLCRLMPLKSDMRQRYRPTG